MKPFLLAGVICGLALVAGAQIPQNPPPVGSARLTQAPTPFGGAPASINTWTMVIENQVQDGAITHLQTVNIVSGVIRITADEADWNQATGEMNLRGNVHMQTRPSPEREFPIPNS